MPNHVILSALVKLRKPAPRPTPRNRRLGRSPAWRLAIPVLLALLMGRPPTSRAADTPISEAVVEDAVRRAVAWIEAQRRPEGHWEPPNSSPDDRNWGGTTALAVLSLLYAGGKAQEEPLASSLDWLASQTLRGTYAYGLRAHVLALVPGRTYRPQLQRDLEWLLNGVGAAGSEAAGAYDYEAAKAGRLDRWDHSNSQYAVLGVWAAAGAGLSVPTSYWELVGDHWLTWQNQDGGWGYQHHEASTGSMTVAGLTALYVSLDQRYADRPREATTLVAGLERGLDWLAREYGPRNPRGADYWHYYYLYGVERVGRASGRKHFGTHDWFRAGTAQLLEDQDPAGFWKGSGLAAPLHNTAWALMFLCHGQAPMVFNKLEHGADWDQRLRDAAGLTRFVGHTFERLLNWQIVRLDSPLEDLLEAPVLYFRGESRWEFSDADVDKLRDYALRGGLIFAVEGKDEGFHTTLEDLARRAFPDLPLRPIGREHPLLNGEVHFAIENPPLLLGIDNGVRLLMLICPRDVAEAWSRTATHGKLDDLWLGANVYLYATDKTTPRSRIQTPLITRRPTVIRRTIRVARIRYNGRWDIEPAGWSRLEAYLHNESATQVLVSSGVTFDSEELRSFSIAHVTGVGPLELTPAERRGLRGFLDRGGTLLADAAGGSAEFTRSLETVIEETMRIAPQSLPADSFLLTGRGLPGAVDLAGTEYRRAARSAASGAPYPRLMAFTANGRHVVLHSPLDLSVGLLGTRVYNLRGYEPDSGLRILRNLLAYAALTTAEKGRLHRGEPVEAPAGSVLDRLLVR